MTVVTNADGKIWLALQSRLSTFTEFPVMLPMSNYAPTASNAFIIVQQVSLDYGGPLPINPNCGVAFSGFMSLGVCAPTDWTYAQLVGLAGRIADHFPNNHKLTYQDINVRINGRSRVDGNLSLQAPWNRLEVRVPWIAWG